jgi:chromosome segregation ATPase
LDRARERLLSAIEKLPEMQAARLQLDSERHERRRGLLERMEAAKRSFDRVDADLVTKATPVEKKLASLRAQIGELESQLAPLARLRLTAMVAYEDLLRSARTELRADAIECEDLMRLLQQSQNEVAHSCQKRSSILNTESASHPRIAAATQELMAAYELTKQIAVTEVDIPKALAIVRRQLADAGIRLATSA